MKKVMLSFDTEEFDVPFEQGVSIPFDEQIRVSVLGTNRILDILRRKQVRATFYCTTVLMQAAPELGRRILAEGHEMASHGCDHTHPLPEHVIESKHLLEQQFGIQIAGYRQPRMFAVSDRTLAAEGYRYNSSLNPAFIPGRYMHLTTPRTAFLREGVWQIPASVTPWLRFPLFWLSAHHLPRGLYEALVLRTLHHDGYFNTYFHPWEFVAIRGEEETVPYGIPYVIGHRCGRPMQQRLEHLIDVLQQDGAEFVTYSEFVARCLIFM